MAKKNFFFGMLVIMLTLGLILVGCDNGNNNGNGGVVDPALIAKWYESQSDADNNVGMEFEFKADGNFEMSGGDTAYPYTATATQFTIVSKGRQITANYKISGTRLSISNLNNTDWYLENETYYKKAN
jgi:hypothetical protein